MERLEIKYDTWERPDADGLFDYHEPNGKNSGQFSTEKSGWIYRRIDDYALTFQKSKIQKQQFQPMLKIIKKEGNFIIQSLNIENEPLCKIITHQKPGLHVLKKYDLLRLGKVEVQIIELSFQIRNKLSRYELISFQLSENKLENVRQITQQFYTFVEGNKQSEQSLIQDNPSCRYCFSKTITKSNPFLVSCHCKGSARYIHQNCLMQWVLKRGHLSQIKGKGVFYADSKIFKCELCHQFFYIPEVWKKIHRYQSQTLKNLNEPIFNEVLILHCKYQNDSLYFIDLSKNKQLSIGRSLQNDVVLNELSVSRQHAFFIINSQKKMIAIKDNQSKFGTLALINMTEIQNLSTYQVGRSKMTFQKVRKKSFFEKIGMFCFVQEKLRTQRKKIPFQSEYNQ